MNEIQKIVTQKLSQNGINAAFFTACLAELLIGYYNDYANEAKEIIKKIKIDDLLTKGNRQSKRILEKKLEKEKLLLLESFKKFELSIISFLRVLDTIDEKTRETLTKIQNEIFKNLEL